MNGTRIVYSTSTESAAYAERKRQTTLAAIARMTTAGPSVPVNGACLSCGSVEVLLNRVTGFRDLSAIGESSRYPIGDGCEACS